MPAGAPARELSVAPMMRVSHAAARHLWRLLCPDALLYTEMCSAEALVRGAASSDKIDASQHPVALQVAGDDPARLAEAARIASGMGFCEINLNCGCPSRKADAGRFGACMMARPRDVADCVAAMRGASELPVSVKCRLGIDDLDPTRCLDEFAAAVAGAGCSKLVVHARKAWLGGLNPKQNRTRPPLDPAAVARVKRNHPGMTVITNGGITSVAQANGRAGDVDGVMVGRAVASNPALLAQFAAEWFGRQVADLAHVARAHLDYCAGRIADGEHPHRLLAPLAGLATGRVGARRLRRAIAQAGADGDVGPVMAAWP